MQVISLNALKKGADNNFHKLEIPIALNKGDKPAQQAQQEFCSKQIDPLAFNSNCQLEFSYAFGHTSVIASLQGPSEAKFGSKQDYEKAFIEVNLKMPQTHNEGNPAQIKAEIQAMLRQSLEAIIQGTTYPKQLFTFQVTVVEDNKTTSIPYSQVFPACLNACIALLN